MNMNVPLWPKKKSTNPIIYLVILFIVVCVLCCAASFVLGSISMVLQSAGILPTDTPRPTKAVATQPAAVTQIIITQVSGLPGKVTAYPTYTFYPTYTAPAALPSHTPLPPPSSTPEPIIGALNERVERGGIALTVLNVSKMDKIDIWTPSEGNIFLVIDVLIENISRDEETPYNALYFSIKDSQSYEYSSSFVYPDPAIKSGNLPKGDKVRGFVAFEVLNAASEYVVAYEPLVIFGGYDPIRVNLGNVP
jgi:hypothetical protein